MIFQTQRFDRLSTFLVLAMQMLWFAPAPAWATDLSIPDKPLFSSYSASPIVMLDVSRDHQLFYKAYNDYTDRNGNGTLDSAETTFDNGFLYYGYFDPTKCYSYSSTQFEPETAGGGISAPEDCGGTNWSGNFLNWVSMSRLDIMRKVLFGGLRVTSADTATATVLERAALPTDAHSWVKYYSGSDISRYTPYTTATSFCNTTKDSSGQSQNTTKPPLIRAAVGNYSLWAANEVWQCNWSNEQNGSNGNNSSVSGINANSGSPSKTGSNADYIVRVSACVTGKIGTENCKSYDGTNYKPVGLLQKYGESTIVSSVKNPPKIYFGLMTGTFTKNISGGVLRKNAKLALANSVNDSGALTPANDEINAATGQFRNIDGIIKTLSKLRIFGYNYSSGKYFNGSADESDTCYYQKTGIVHSGGDDSTQSSSQGKPANEGKCASWGNPMSELYIESLRYLAGKSATNEFLYSTGPDTKVGLPAPATWTDPLNSKNYCSPLNILMFNASVSSFDNDQASTPFSDLGSSKSLSAWTDEVGDGEGITGEKAFVGRIGGTGADEGVCTAKTVTSLSSVSGICPESPSLYGSYFMAGAAYFAHTNRIRGHISDAADTSTPYTVNTYAVQMATNVPRIKIPGTSVVIQPAYFLDFGNKGTGTIVDFKIIETPTNTSGKFYVSWEDSNQGGDYDMDVQGLISYTVSGTTLKITTKTISEATGNPQGFGYTISGTDKDGVHFHSGIENFNFNDSTGLTVTPDTHRNNTGGCKNCNVTDAATTATYTIGGSGSSALALQDPMYYAAKWGGFSTASGTTPATVSSWDSKNNSTGVAGSDGLPDNYYYVNDPGVLEAALERAFSGISNTTSGSAVAASTSSLQTGTHIYQAIFNPKTWVGDLLDYTINPSTLMLSKKWSAKEKIATQAASDRNIFTSKTDRTAVSFTWSNISSDQQTTLGSEDKLNYIRGDGTNEGDTSGKFRRRDSKLGDIIDSNPVYVGKPSGQYTSVNRFLTAYVNGDGYMSWRTTHLSRTAMIYVGANDGMLHGFKAEGDEDNIGKESFAYIPSQVYPNIATLSNQNYAENHKYSVNGSPEVAEIGWGTGVSATWKTVLVSGLRKGGKGLFALDVTAPDSFSASNVLWEFRDSDDSDGDLGYVYGTPVIAKMANGKWMAIFGNGYNSTNGKAALYLVEIEKATATAWSSDATTGNYKKIILESGPSNGLGPVTPFDIDLNGVPDALYAGDLKGNLWKIDVSSDDPANWGVALSGTALAVAKTSAHPLSGCTANATRPITNPPAVTWHPNSIEQAMVYFGSGKYIESADVSADTCDAFYGVWDNNSQTNSDRTNFASQTIQTDATTSERTIQSESPISAWGTHTAGDSTYTGWVQDLPLRERQTGAISVLGGMVFYNTFLPNTNLCDCGGTGYLMGVSYINGGKASPFLNDDNTVKTDVVGLPVGGALGGSTILTSGSEGTALALSNTTKGSGATDPGTGGGGSDQACKDGLGSCQKLNSKALSGTRISWREVIQK